MLLKIHTHTPTHTDTVKVTRLLQPGKKPCCVHSLMKTLQKVLSCNRVGTRSRADTHRFFWSQFVGVSFNSVYCAASCGVSANIEPLLLGGLGKERSALCHRSNFLWEARECLGLLHVGRSESYGFWSRGGKGGGGFR